MNVRESQTSNYLGTGLVSRPILSNRQWPFRLCSTRQQQPTSLMKLNNRLKKVQLKKITQIENGKKLAKFISKPLLNRMDKRYHYTRNEIDQKLLLCGFLKPI